MRVGGAAAEVELTHGTGPVAVLRGAPARVPGVEMRGSTALAPPLCVCGDVYLTLPYLTSTIPCPQCCATWARLGLRTSSSCL